MVSWGWVIGAFLLGDAVGIIIMAIMFANWDRLERKAQKK